MKLLNQMKAIVSQHLLAKFNTFPTKQRESIALEAKDADWMVLRHLLPVGSHVVDVGAGVGLSSRALAELVGETGRVTSIEPVPKVFDHLRGSVRKLRLQQIEPLCCAISSVSGTQSMIVHESYQHSRMGNEAEEKETLIDVRTETLDGLFARLRPMPELICLDVPGHALNALRGAGELLRRFKPAWRIRVDGNPDRHLSPMHELFRMFELRGYLAFCFNGEKLHQWRTTDGERSAHAFFLTQRHLRRLPAAWLPTETETEIRLAA